jgi:iron complex outermembrane receptor protein
MNGKPDGKFGLAHIEGFTMLNNDVIRTRFDVDDLVDKDRLSFISCIVTGEGLFWPLPPRTFPFTISGEI